MSVQDTYLRQLKREEEQVAMGIERYRQAVNTKDLSDITAGQILVKRAVEPVALAIQEMVDKVELGKAGKGRPARSVPYLRILEPHAVAYITARTCINACATNERTAKTAMALATLIEDQYNFDELRQNERNLANNLERKAKKWSTAHHRTTIMRLGVKIANIKGLEWSENDKLSLGMKLIELFIETTGLVEQVLVREGRTKTNYRLRPNEKTAEWLDRMHSRLELLEPRFTPMVHPPKDWTNPVNGGYLTRGCRMDFIGSMSAEFRDDVFSIEMPEVYRAVNAIQATRWKVNRGVFNVVTQLWTEGSTLGNLPSQDPMPIPARPAHISSDIAREDMTSEMREEFDSWRQEAAKAHERNAALISKRLSVASKLSMATDLVDEEAIYFPHYVDFRGRAYCAVPDLSPQGDDLGKALLTFADGKRLGENGAYWLHVHIANCFGIDKVSYDDRVAWVREHHELLMDSALNPLDGQRFWLQADAKSTWCALAACFEYMGWVIEGNDYVSHLPIAMDGTCSGLQHFSAMLRDVEGGKAVNLLPCEKPADIYSAVKDQTEAELLKSSEQLAMSWRGMVTRKIVKRPCMTFAYSVTSRGMRDQILDEMKKAANGGDYLAGWDNYEAATFLAPIVESAIRNTVKKAAVAMDWLKLAVKPVIEQNVPINWRTPDGFPVQHRYVKTNGKKFEVWFQGVRVRIQLRIDTTNQDIRKHQSAIAPNYVHSLDATHLRMVVLRLYDAMVTKSFAMIHDSFGVHACDVDDLHYAIRDTFIVLYGGNVLEDFAEQMRGVLPEDKMDEVPSAPEMGDLSLEEVRASDFFFS